MMAKPTLCSKGRGGEEMYVNVRGGRWLHETEAYFVVVYREMADVVSSYDHCQPSEYERASD
jgi:hypothetical protein